MVKKLNNKSARGVVLLLTLFLLSTAIAIVLVLSNTALTEIGLTRNIEESIISIFAADSGIECELYNQRKNDPVISGFCNSAIMTNNSGFTVSIPADPSPCLNNRVKSIGQYPFVNPRTLRAIEVCY